MWFFDYYSATLREDEAALYPDEAVGQLASWLGAEKLNRDKGRYGYDNTAYLQREGETLALIAYGGRNKWPLVSATGWHAPEVASVLRDHVTHEVTRLDSTTDIVQVGAFEELCELAQRVADKYGVAVADFASRRHDAIEGRTRYVGSRRSAVFARIYEKGRQLRKQASSAEELRGYPEEWARVELQVRPQKDAKRLASRWTPEEAWGASAWSSELFTAISGLEVERIQMKPWRPSDDERAMNFMLRQYGAVILRRVKSAGSWERFGLEVEATMTRKGML